VTFTVVVEAGFIEFFRELRASDKETAHAMRKAVNSLATDPEPDGSIGWGQSGFRRLHIGEWRVLYEVDGELIRVWTLGRTPSR
jgi:mRNA-degrading endonuclease RelE of RelBE toxin-antitoxin system